MRKYSIEEIDRMRFAIREGYGTYAFDSEEIERRLRTHMINGTDPDDLDQWAEKQKVATRKWQDQLTAMMRHDAANAADLVVRATVEQSQPESPPHPSQSDSSPAAQLTRRERFAQWLRRPLSSV